MDKGVVSGERKYSGDNEQASLEISEDLRGTCPPIKLKIRL